MFGERDKAPQVRQRIRDLQCIILSTLFKISATCLERLQIYTTTSNNDESTSTSTTDETASLFAPMGILCSWIYSTFIPISTDSGVSVEQYLAAPNKNTQRTSGDRVPGGSGGSTVVPTDVFSLFMKYTAGPGVSESMMQQSNTLSKFSRALATLGTTLLSFADAEGDPRTFPEDIPLLGFSPMKPYYTANLNPRGLKQALERGAYTTSSEDAAAEIVFSRASRVLALAKRMGEQKEVEFFRYEERKEKAGEFVVKDEESKRLARLKTAKSLALQLLKTQILTLETNLSSSSRTPTTTTYIPDASIYTNHLSLIKTLLIPRRRKGFVDLQHQHQPQERRLLVPTDIVHQLDNLKKGSRGIHARAREATRYLEQRFRYGSDALVSQQSGQTVKDVQYAIAPTPEDEERDGGYYTTPPKYLRSFIGCCLYFQKRGVEAERERVQRMQEIGVEIGEEEMAGLDHGRVFVVSEDEEVILECRRCGVAVKTVEELRKSGEYGVRW
ncbi:UNVERIFIED_CONTAM: hypothetical protein HDU68_008446 [Siphonaria sp. JEL0065]|nr:hypothetical protein HDU68_008446 [Siphonaria sp. JEL0065]